MPTSPSARRGCRARGCAKRARSQGARRAEPRAGARHRSISVAVRRARTPHQFAAAIGTDVIHLVAAVGAEGALVGADVVLAFLRGRRVATFAFRTHFQSHRTSLGQTRAAYFFAT